MKAVILAAGVGTRIGENDRPKALLPLGDGTTILSRLIAQLLQHRAEKELLLVVGYQKEKIQSAFPTIPSIVNPAFAEENTAKSLLRAIEGIEEDLFWINGDVVCHNAVLDRSLHLGETHMIVHSGPVGEEEVKFRTNSQGMISEIGKEVVADRGESVGLHFWKKRDLPLLKEGLLRASSTDYFERGIAYAIEQGVSVRAVEIDPSLALEVDFPEDWERAQRAIRSWKAVE